MYGISFAIQKCILLAQVIIQYKTGYLVVKQITWFNLQCAIILQSKTPATPVNTGVAGVFYYSYSTNKHFHDLFYPYFTGFFMPVFIVLFPVFRISYSNSTEMVLLK